MNELIILALSVVLATMVIVYVYRLRKYVKQNKADDERYGPEDTDVFVQGPNNSRRYDQVERDRKHRRKGVLSVLLLCVLVGCSSTPKRPPCAANDLACRMDKMEAEREDHRRCTWLHGADSILCGGSR